MFTTHGVYLVLGISITLLSCSQVYARWYYQCEQGSIDSDNGLAPYGRQAIILTNDGPV